MRQLLRFLLLVAAVCVASAAVVKKRQAVYGHVLQPVAYAIKKPLREHEKEQDLTKIPGVPGVDYPVFHSVPPTNFHCGNVPAVPGIYANVETGCQAYHVCHDGREGHQGASFLCTNGTLFNQHEFACDWWYNVNCAEAPSLYSLNLDPIKNPYAPKPKKIEGAAVVAVPVAHAAVPIAHAAVPVGHAAIPVAHAAVPVAHAAIPHHVIAGRK